MSEIFQKIKGRPSRPSFYLVWKNKYVMKIQDGREGRRDVLVWKNKNEGVSPHG
jgi:hypothetical protein